MREFVRASMKGVCYGSFMRGVYEFDEVSFEGCRLESFVRGVGKGNL
jgi:hypothetical protein